MLSIYLDTNIVSSLAKRDLKDETMKLVLEIVQLAKNGKVMLYTSELTQEEIALIPEQFRYHHNLIYYLIKNIAIFPESCCPNLITQGLGIGGGLITKGLGAGTEDPIFVSINRIIPKPLNEGKVKARNADVKHIFQSKKNNIDIFWTEDRKTILNKKNEFYKIGINVKSSKEVLDEITQVNIT